MKCAFHRPSFAATLQGDGSFSGTLPVGVLGWRGAGRGEKVNWDPVCVGPSFCDDDTCMNVVFNYIRS